MKTKLSLALALYLLVSTASIIPSSASEAAGSGIPEDGYVVYDSATGTEIYLPASAYPSQVDTALAGESMGDAGDKESQSA